MAKDWGNCPECGSRVDFDSADDEALACPACDAVLDRADLTDPMVGKTLGEFEIVERIGRGGMGTVYKAAQPSLGRFVAVKVLPPEFSRNPNFLVRFDREARAAAAVRHPNIVDIHTVGEDRGVHYIAMELVGGENLSQIVQRDGALPAGRALEIMKQAADALAKAHAAGIVHRDIKPSNLLLTAKGLVKVADFGLAKRPDVDASVTQTGKGLGTPQYLPPSAPEASPSTPAATCTLSARRSITFWPGGRRSAVPRRRRWWPRSSRPTRRRCGRRPPTSRGRCAASSAAS